VNLLIFNVFTGFSSDFIKTFSYTNIIDVLAEYDQVLFMNIRVLLKTLAYSNSQGIGAVFFLKIITKGREQTPIFAKLKFILRT
jgi:hypothetical protein